MHRHLDRFTVTPAGPPREPPMKSLPGPVDWARRNLFNGMFNTILTLIVGYVLLMSVPYMLWWSVLGAEFGAVGAEACVAHLAEVGGACWGAIWEKWGFILFGTYPLDERWRPFIACVLITAAMIASGMKRFWGLQLAPIWAVAIIGFFVLMGGGVLGLSEVRTSQWGGLPLTLMLSVFGAIFAFPLAILVALGRRSSLPAIKTICVLYVEFVRGVPLITVLFMASFMFPLFLPEGVDINNLLRAQVGIILFIAAYLAEVVRGGLQAIPKGQYEAASALGLGYWKQMALIVLPQALKISIPPIVNTLIGMFKDTSLILIIGLFDILALAKSSSQDTDWARFYIEYYVFVALIFWAYCWGMSQYSQWLERDLHRGHNR